MTSAITSMNTGFQTQTSALVFSPGSSQPGLFTSGLWGRAIGGRVDTDSMSTGDVFRKPLLNATIAISCSTQTGTTTMPSGASTILVGVNLGASGWNAHFGVAGGFFETEQGSGSTRLATKSTLV